jgi:PAS domain S-box-containing protein
MRRILIIVYSALLVILLGNYLYYKNLYNKQIKYITDLLDRQVQLVGNSVDNSNNGFASDLNKMCFDFNKDLQQFFTNKDIQARAEERMKLFFTKYGDLITGIKLYDDHKNEYTLKRDEAQTGWLNQTFVLHVQAPISNMEKLVKENHRYDYYQTINNTKDNVVVGNIVVSVDFQKYFKEIFTAFNFKEYQWQWVVSDSGEIVYDNNERKIKYSQLNRITSSLANGSVGNVIHNASIDGRKTQLISSYYSTQLLQRDLGIVFSSPTDRYQKDIIRNSLFIVLGTILLIQVIIYIFWKYIRSQKTEMDRLKASEKMLFKLIEEMPVGVIIHNKSREIIKANKVAADQYGYKDEGEMKGKIFPETTFHPDNNYFSKNLGGTFNADQFVIIKKEIGEVVLYRNSIAVNFMGEEATMEILIDVTLLESARKHEAKANVAKSEFLARMSYEIRTPLNGIIGMTDVLNRYDLSAEVQEIVNLLRRSTEVLLNIINDILDFSKIESGKMILDEVPFNLREEITYCTDLARTRLIENSLDMTCTVDDNVPESIIGDPYRLRQILTNLINHSIKNTENGEIRLKCMLKRTDKGLITLSFTLQDTGLTFDKASLKKIFGDFVNIESKAVRTNDESGFGTILANQLVELMGGELSAESPSGLPGDKGLKVSFTIITYSNDRIIKNLPLEKIKSFDKIRTLVITGNQNRDEETLSALHKFGLTVNITTFMKSTIGQIKSNLNYPGEKYNLVIIFDEPEFNGFNVARLFWENNISGEFIIMMIGSNDKKGNYMNCISQGIDHYLIKPFDDSELLGVIKNSFPYIEDSSQSFDIGTVRNDIRLLIVEDNKMNQKVIGTMLKTLGYSFDVADDGYAGYIQAKTRKYDLIFMDLVMPEMDGFESAQKILNYDNSPVIVAFTADNMPESKRKAELSGIKDFIPKPVRIDELKRLFAKYFKK